MSMTQRFIKMWLIIGVYCIALFLALGMPFVLVGDASRTNIIASTLLGFIGSCIVSVIFGVMMYRNWSPRILRDTHEHGMVASATITELNPTGWRIRGYSWSERKQKPMWSVEQGGISRSSKYRKFEYKMRVEVRRPDLPPYEAVIFQPFPKDQVPTLGDEITVKVHPERVDVVVLVEDEVHS